MKRMVEESEKFAESDKARRVIIEESNRAESFCADTTKSLQEFEAQLDKEEREKVAKLLEELREVAAKGAAGDASVKAEDIKSAMDAAQTASLGLFQKVSFLFICSASCLLRSLFLPYPYTRFSFLAPPSSTSHRSFSPPPSPFEVASFSRDVVPPQHIWLLFFSVSYDKQVHS